ncbi:MAG TPA: hypothetical protein VMY88_00450 [Acidimicrobiales bacterium]|nr:hypothetical protein [Acidimicrobiales bacterium]
MGSDTEVREIEAGEPAGRQEVEDRPTRRVVLVIAALIALMMAGAAGAAFGPGRGIRTDIADQRGAVRDQLEALHRQLEITQAQLEHIKATRSSSQRTVELAETQLSIIERQLALLEKQDGKTDEALRIQRRLLEVAEETLREVKEINRKTPPAGAAGTTTTSVAPR